MKVLSYAANNAEEVIGQSLEVLKNGGVIAYPTESFYALGVYAKDETAVKRLYKIKKRPADKPLPVIVGEMETLRTIVKSVPLQAEALIKEHWPGPLTIIFEAVNDLPDLLTGSSGRIAIRIPGESVALDLAKKAKFPVAATSANLSGSAPSRSATEVTDYFENHIDLVIDGGDTPGGKPSTIVDVTSEPPIVLREGRILLKPENNL